MADIAHPGRAWPYDWESRHEAGACSHQWETVSVETWPGNVETVDRCRQCHTPRCDRLDDRDTKCRERRHHGSLHIFESGLFEPVGGYLRDEDNAHEAP